MKFGYTLLYVRNVKETMDFYERAFGLAKGFLHENQYGEMVTGETKLGFVNHDTASTHGFEFEESSLQKKPSAFEVGFVTKDVETAFKNAVNAGAIAVSMPKTKPWGQVVSYVRDCNGFLIEICSPMA